VTHGVPHRSTASVGHDRLSQNVLVHARTVVLLADRILAIRTTSSGMTTLATRISDVVAGASAGVDGRGDTFSADQRTWERADVTICGAPEISCDPITEIVVAPPVPVG
jgi:hypothetical protein